MEKCTRQQEELDKLQEHVRQLEDELDSSAAVTSNAEEIQKTKYANAIYNVKKILNMPDLIHPESDILKACTEAAHYRASRDKQNLLEQVEAIRHHLGYHEGNRFPEFFEWCSGGVPCEQRSVLQTCIAYCNKNDDGWIPKRPIFAWESRVTRLGPDEGLKIYSCFRKGLGTLNNYHAPIDIQKYIRGLIIAHQFLEAVTAQSRYAHQEKRRYYISQFGFTDASQQPITKVYCYDVKFPCRQEGNVNHLGNDRLFKIINKNYAEYKRFRDSGTSTDFFSTRLSMK